MKIIPPLAAILYMIAAWGVTRLLPNDPLITRGATSMAVAAILAAAGVALGIASVVTFRRHQTTVDPFGTPEHLVTNGPFAFTRNPMYVGITLLLAGHGVFNGQAAFLAVPVAFLLTANKFYVPREEAILAELFGPQFGAYKAEVRRWI
ncbi:MAG TPA: isoprenylcysteine carboxylmethyltransferase family protein [Gemmatimonadales bacterium]